MASDPNLRANKESRCSVCLLMAKVHHPLSCCQKNICQACTDDEKTCTHCNAKTDDIRMIAERGKASKNCGVARKAMQKLRAHRHDICSVLSIADLLLPFVIKLYGRGIVSMHVKNKVIETGSLRGADILLDCVETAIKAKPQRWHVIFNIMKDVEDLKDVLERMENTDLTDEEETMESYEDESGLKMITDLEEAGKMARNLREQFKDLLRNLYKCIKDEDAGEIKLLIANRLSCDGDIPADILAKLDELDAKDTPSSVLTFLVSRKLVGYLNYEIIGVLSKEFGKQELYQTYEKAHDSFLQSVSCSVLLEMFRDEPELAPPSDIGLPMLKVHLSELWEGKSVYSWKAFVKKQFHFLPDLTVVKIARKCILIQYAVLPFIASIVVEEFSNEEVLRELESAGVTIELSEEVMRMEINSKAYSMLELHSAEIVRLIESPVLVAYQLFSEDMLDEAVVGEIGQCLSLSDQKYLLLGSVFESLRSNHRNLKVFCSVLLHYRDTVCVGKSLLKQYNLKYSESKMQASPNKDAYNDNGSLFLVPYNSLIEAVNTLFSSVNLSLGSKAVDINNVKSFMSSFPELCPEVGVCESVADVMAVVQCYTSLVNISYFKALMHHFKIREESVMMQLYEDNVQELCKGVPLRFFDGNNLMNMFDREILNSEKLLITFDQTWLERTLSEVLLQKTLRVVYTYVSIKEIHSRDDSSIILLSYFPVHLNSILIKLVQSNEQELFKEGVIAVDCGNYSVLKYKEEPESLESHVPMDKKMYLGILKENEDLRQENIVLHNQVASGVAKHHCLQEVPFKLGVWRLFTSLMHARWSNVIQTMKASGVEIAFSSKTLKFKGDPDMVDEMKHQIHQLQSSVKELQFPVTHSVAHFLVHDPKGQAVLENIEKDTSVCIELQDDDDVALASRTNSLPPTKDHGFLMGLSAGVYQNIKITKGDILKHQEDVTVCSLGGQVYLALLEAGLSVELQESVSTEDVVITRAYNLLSKYIFYVYVQRYYDYESEPALRSIFRKCLIECSRLRVKSVSIPSIGVGQLFYPPTVVSKCFLEETVDYLTENQGETSLELVHFVLLDDKCHAAFQDQYSHMLSAFHMKESCGTLTTSDASSKEHGIRQGQNDDSDYIVCIYGETDHSVRLAVERLRYVYSVMIHTNAANHALNALFMEEVPETLRRNHISSGQLNSFITSSFPEFTNEIQPYYSIEATLHVVRSCTSLVNPVYLRDIAEHFNLEDIIVKLDEYNKSIRYLQEEIPLKKFRETMFMDKPNFPGFKTLQFHLNLNWLVKSIKDLQTVEDIGMPVDSRYNNLSKIDAKDDFVVVDFVVPSHLTYW